MIKDYITTSINYIISDKHYTKYEIIEIAKGKYKKGSFLKRLKRKIKIVLKWR